MGELYSFVGTADYFILAAAALIGLYCMFMVMNRLISKRFKNEQQQDEFLQQVESYLQQGDYDSVSKFCAGDTRALSMMVALAVQNRDIESEQLEGWLMDRFQFDVMSHINANLGWISTIIKAAPMLGLIGTVAGMMGAFETLEKATAEEPTKQLLADIRMALEHTLFGLLITVTLLTAMAHINNKIRELEELVVFGLNRFFDTFRETKPKSRLNVRS